MTRRLDAGHWHRKAGVVFGNFFSQGVAQLKRFDENGPRVNSEALMSLMDKLNQQGRAHCIVRGTYSAGVANEAGDVFAVLHDTAG